MRPEGYRGMGCPGQCWDKCGGLGAMLSCPHLISLHPRSVPGKRLHGPHLTAEERSEASGGVGNSQSHSCHSRLWASFQDCPQRRCSWRPACRGKRGAAEGSGELQSLGLRTAGLGSPGLAPTSGQWLPILLEPRAARCALLRKWALEERVRA